MSRTLTIGGDTLESMGLVLLAGSKPYQPALPKSLVVDIPGSSMHVDGTEFATGRPEFSAVDSEYADCLVMPSLLNLADTAANRAAIVRDVVASLDGQRLSIVDSDWPEHTLDARLSVSVTEAPRAVQVRISWTRQAVRELERGEHAIDGIEWEQQALPYIDGEVDGESVALLGTEPTGLDYSECAWMYALCASRPQSPVGELVAPTLTPTVDRYATWDSSTNAFTASASTRFTLEFSATGAAVAQDTVAVILIEATTQFATAGMTVQLYADGALVAETGVSVQYGYTGNVNIRVPAGTQSAVFSVSTNSQLGAYVSFSNTANALGSAFRELVGYGDEGFDYSGYYEYVDGTGMVDATTIASPSYTNGKVYKSSDMLQAVPSAWTALYPSPTFVPDLFYASFDVYSVDVSVSNQSSYAFPLEVTANVDCTVELNGRSVSIAGTGDTYTTDMPMEDGSNSVHVEVPYSEPDGGASPSVTLTWRRGDL